MIYSANSSMFRSSPRPGGGQGATSVMPFNCELRWVQAGGLESLLYTVWVTASVCRDGHRRFRAALRGGTHARMLVNQNCFHVAWYCSKWAGSNRSVFTAMTAVLTKNNRKNCSSIVAPSLLTGFQTAQASRSSLTSSRSSERAPTRKLRSSRLSSRAGCPTLARPSICKRTAKNRRCVPLRFISEKVV